VCRLNHHGLPGSRCRRRRRFLTGKCTTAEMLPQQFLSCACGLRFSHSQASWTDRQQPAAAAHLNMLCGSAAAAVAIRSLYSPESCPSHTSCPGTAGSAAPGGSCYDSAARAAARQASLRSKKKELQRRTCSWVWKVSCINHDKAGRMGSKHGCRGRVNRQQAE
jgi:hypothetical protein